MLLPDLASRIGTMRTGDLCRLAMRLPDVAASLVGPTRLCPTDAMWASLLDAD